MTTKESVRMKVVDIDKSEIKEFARKNYHNNFDNNK